MYKFSGKKLKNILKEKKLSGMKLAKKLSVSRQAVSTWINDINSPNGNIVIAICHILNCDFEDLFEDRK